MEFNVFLWDNVPETIFLASCPTRKPGMLVLGLVLGLVLCLSTKNQVLVLVLGLEGRVLVLVLGLAG